MEEERAARRQKFEELKQQKVERKKANQAAGIVVDVDFDLMVQEEKKKVQRPMNHVSSDQMKICVCVRKRPLFEKETMAGEIDSVSCGNPRIVVHETKLKVDGITKFIHNHDFDFDNTYSEQESSKPVYEY